MSTRASSDDDDFVMVVDDSCSSPVHVAAASPDSPPVHINLEQSLVIVGDELAAENKLEEEKKETSSFFVRTDIDEFSQPFKNMWVDAQDKHKKEWYEAQVVKILDGGESVIVHFKKFSSKWNEQLFVGDTTKFAPLHTHTPRPISTHCQSMIELRVNAEVDAMDTQGNWMPSHIIDISTKYKQIKVHYLHWGHKWDEWLNSDSYRIAPVRTYTVAARPRAGRDEITISEEVEASFTNKLATRGLAVMTMASDGNCLFRAMAQHIYGDVDCHVTVRQKIMEYVLLQSTHFSAFIEEPIDEYCERMAFSCEWGGEIEITAANELYGRPIEIFAVDAQPIRVYSGRLSIKPIQLSYHSQCHYNCVVDNSGSYRTDICREPPGCIEDAVMEQLRFEISNPQTPRALLRQIEQNRDGLAEEDKLPLQLALQRSISNASAISDLDRALLLSAQEQKQPEGGDMCANIMMELSPMGFTTEQIREAYALLHDTHDSHQSLMQAIVNYLLEEAASIS